VVLFSVNDFQKLAGKECIYHEKQDSVQLLPESNFNDSNDLGNQDVLSNSSLRRKLFFHGDDGTPISPVRYGVSVATFTFTAVDF
jgi:hypothetical protein